MDKISRSMIITTEEDRKYLDSLSELEREVVLADCFEQFKRAEELRIALSIAQCLEVCANNSVSNVEQVYDTVGYPSIGASDDGGDTVGGWYAPANMYNYPSNYFPPSAEVYPSSEIAVETTMNMLPGC